MWEVLIDSWNGSAASSWLKLWFYLTVYSLIFILLATDCLFTWRTFSVPRWWCGWSELASYWSKREGTTCSSKCYKPPAGLLAHISCTQKKTNLISRLQESCTMPAFVFAVLAVRKSRKNLPQTLICISRTHLGHSPRKGFGSKTCWTWLDEPSANHLQVSRCKELKASNSNYAAQFIGCICAKYQTTVCYLNKWHLIESEAAL